MNHTRLAVLLCVIVADACCLLSQTSVQERQSQWTPSEDSANAVDPPAAKTAVRKKQVDEKASEACKISVIVDNEKKLGGFVFRQMEAELNRILRTGGANIQVKMSTTGRADYALRIRDFPPKASVEGEILGQTSEQDPHNSFLFVEAIEDVWRRGRALPRGGRGIVYARVYAHELAAHGILGWAHSRAEDKDMGFLGSGKNWSDFLFNNDDDSKFEFSRASGRLLNLRCRFGNDAQRLNPAGPAGRPGPG